MVNIDQIYIELSTNILLLFSMGSIYILLPFAKLKNNLYFNMLIGVISGFIGVMIMSNQFFISEGILLDTRSVLVTLVGAFFGAIPLAITFLMTAALRIIQGGSGTFTGILVIATTGLVGLVYGKLLLKKHTKLNYKVFFELYLLGFVTHIVMLLCFFTLPGGIATTVLGKITFPVLLLYPLATMMIAAVLFKQKVNTNLTQKIDHISKHDYLTGLYNRYYFENSILNFDKSQYYPLSVIIGDVNGLKTVNDSLGHHIGDKLLISISNILKDSINENMVLSRWGGDEFIIIMPNSDSVTANDITLKITKKCAETTIDEGIIPSISLGMATKENNKFKMDKFLKRAEDLMYRNKLSSGKSVRSNLISILENTLLERSLETTTHTQNMEVFCVNIAEKLELSHSEIEELRLIAKLHDIGKIGISDTILLKKGKLTPSEYKIIQNHADIGFRILSSIEEISHIASGVLHHHEKWDGTGYPSGLSKHEIPLVSRIVSVADAFEVMTNGRIYKEAIPEVDAIEELIRCKATQFDPDIVDIFIDIRNKNR